MLTLLIFIIVISILVFVHELGHFLSARRLGVAVEEFGFGFPPRLIGLRRKDTIYSINWIPFGGFVKLKGETADRTSDQDSFAAQSKTRRFLILSAGVIMNYLLTIVLFTIGYSVGLPAAHDPTAPNPALQDIRPQVIRVEAGSPAAQAGLRVGDVIISAADTPVSNPESLKAIQEQYRDRDLPLVIRHGSSERTVIVRPTPTENDEIRIGIALLNIGHLQYPFPQSLLEGTKTTLNVTGQIFVSFGHLLRDLVVDRKVSQDVSGPVGIIVLTREAFNLGFPYLLQFVALLSATLAVINFLPFPGLDGGRALFVTIEAFRGRAVDQRIESLVHVVGFYLLIALVLLVSVRDVQKFGVGERLLDGLKNVLGR